MAFIAEQWQLVSLLAALLIALLVVESLRGGKPLSHHEVTRLLNKGEAVLLDVRDAKEFKTGHIAESINIPYAKLAERAAELDKFRARTIIVADRIGQHAGAAGKLLKARGFTVNRLQGGITEWTSQNLPVVKS